MVVLGLILIVLAVLLGSGVAISSTQSATLEIFGADLGVTVSGVFFAGAVTAAGLLAGLWLLKKGTGRTYRRRKEVKELRHQVEAAPTVAAAGTPDTADTTDTAGSELAGDETDGAAHPHRPPSAGA